MFKSQYIKIIVHTLIWCTYFLFPILFLSKPSEVLLNNEANLVTHVVTTVFLITFFYLNYQRLVPDLFIKHKYILYFSCVIIFFVFSLLLGKLINNYIYTNTLHEPNYFGYWFRFFLIFAVSFGLRLNQRLRNIETEKTRSELLSLKAQINPHFLFNILNDIYGQAIIKSDQTAESIARLSSMMRYVLTEADAEKVTLEKEVRYIQSYVELQKIRVTEKTKIKFEVNGDIHSKTIPALIFISFIENAFKYGVSNERETTITIDFNIESETLTLQVKNEKVSKTTDSYNIGISNTSRRLDLIYGDNYSLKINEDKKIFEVNLKIPYL